MIYEYYLLTSSGIPILEEKFLEIAESDKKPMFASAMSAIAGLIEVTTRERMTYVEIGGAYIYIGGGEKFIVLLVSDEQNPRYQNLAIKILNLLENRFSPENFEENPKLKDAVKNIFRSEIMKFVPVISSIKRLLEKTLSSVEVTLDRTLFELLEEVKAEKKILDVSVGKKISPLLVEALNFDTVVQNILDCNLSQAFIDLYLNIDSLSEDKLILLVWFGVVLNRFGLKIPAPDLLLLKEISKSIKNEKLREYLESLIESFDDIDAFKKRFQISEIPSESKLLCVALIDSGNDIIKRCITKFWDNRSILINGLLDLSETIMKPTETFNDINSWLVFVGDKRLKLEKSKNCVEFALLSYIKAVLRFLEIKTVNLEIIKSFLEELKARRRILKEIDAEGCYMPAYWLTKSIYYNYIEFLDNLISEREKTKLSDVMENIRLIANEINSLRKAYISNRIERPIYLTAISNALLKLLQLYSLRGGIPKEAIDLLDEVFDEKMEEIKDVASSLFILYSSSLLEITGIIAEFIRNESFKRSVFQRIGYLFEKLAIEFKEIEYLSLLLNLRALIYYLRSMTDTSLESAKEISSNITNNYPDLEPIIRSLYSRFGINKRIIKLKALILGDPTVGKTTLVNKYLRRALGKEYKPTIGVDIYEKDTYFADKRIGEVIIRWQIWDVAGDKKWKTLREDAYLYSDGIVLMYDISKKETYKHVIDWLKEALKYEKDFEVILVGNKIDLRGKTECLETEKGEELRGKLERLLGKKVIFIETSALFGTNVDEVFEELARMILNKRLRKTSS